MKALPKSLKNAISALQGLPGLGEKSATRIAMYLLDSPQERVKEFCDALLKMKQSIRRCRDCFHLSDDDLCPVCSDPARDPQQICVVETTSDLLSIEQADFFKGRYHVLGGTLDPINNISPEDLTIPQLLDRIKRDRVKEIIIATNPTQQGEATAHYLVEVLKEFPVTVTRIGVGIPMGGDLKYIDPVTIRLALEARRSFP
ncbi:MAG: recombination protein RecR [Deltaproteobacteria bacterium]|nr:recombination protein RecR [Deltaproteobacteria bacterium]MBW2067924.1 recombination protein RecR [Deltaproteobacteria bacterium]